MFLIKDKTVDHISSTYRFIVRITFRGEIADSIHEEMTSKISKIIKKFCNLKLAIFGS